MKRTLRFPVRVAAILLAIFAAILPASTIAAEHTPFPPGRIRGPSDEVAEIIIRGRTLRNAGSHAAALALFDEALATARAKKDHSGEAWSLSNIATVYRYRAKDEKSDELADKAADYYTQAIKLSREKSDRYNEAYATLYLGVLAAARDDTDLALKNYAVALSLFEAVKDRYYIARTLVYIAQATAPQEPEKALALFEQSLPHFREVKMWHEAAEVLGQMYNLYRELATKPQP